MGHYIANVRDLEFNLFEVLDIGNLLDTGAYGDLDADTAHAILSEVAHLSEGIIAASYIESDRTPVEFVPGEHTITVPDALRKTVAAVHEAGWSALGVPEQIGGTNAPKVLMWATQEMIGSANPSALFFNMGPQMHAVLYTEGNEDQKRWAQHAFEAHWGGTMVLTEPDAGSDVGAGRTKAIAQPDGTWHIEGVKRFISGGDVGDTSENILHLVLARPEGAGPGTKGLSLFVVPKVLFDPDTMALGERNGVYATNLEHKMGLRSSPTCELSFGLHDRPAVGYLVGDVHSGIAQMFKVIENARMMVGTKSAGGLSAGYLQALGYAKTRVQGADLTRMMDKAAERVTIIHHPDVRRSLMTQKAYAEGLRALYMYTGAMLDTDVAAHCFDVDDDMARRINDFLLPIVKGAGSERGYEMLTESLQTLGGSGYLQDYPIEQYVRDMKIDSLYEGTTAIQAQDFFFRKIVRDGGVAFTYLTDQIRAFTETTGAGRLKAEQAKLGAALDDVAAMVQALSANLVAAQQDPRAIYNIGLGSVRFLLAVGDLVIGWRLLVQAHVALAALDANPDQDTDFYTGKIAAARFFANNILPLLSGVRAVIEAMDYDVMELAESAF